MFLFSILLLCVIVVVGFEFLRGSGQLIALESVRPMEEVSPPKVSVIIPARNEEKTVAKAFQTLLAQDYRNIEFILVNDRSSDKTGEILKRFAESDPRVSYVEIDELPPGWLGKNHAIYVGCQRAEGEYYLFTDADVAMKPYAVSKAVSHMRRYERDFLVGLPRFSMKGVFLQAFEGFFSLFAEIVYKPWKVSDPASPAYAGIGAFNLISKEAYEGIGTYKAIALRPDDDSKLGKVVKEQGYAEEVVWASDAVFVEWYTSIPELFNGFVKNILAAADYSVAKLAVGTLVAIALMLFPYLALFSGEGMIFGINLATVSILSVLYIYAAHRHRLKRWPFFLLPFSMLMFAIIVWRAVALTYIKGGIDWRGTFYSLKELKTNKV